MLGRYSESMSKFDHHGTCPNCGGETTHYDEFRLAGVDIVRCLGQCGAILWHSGDKVDGRKDKGKPACSVCKIPLEGASR